jgi:hypothetical protein
MSATPLGGSQRLSCEARQEIRDLSPVLPRRSGSCRTSDGPGVGDGHLTGAEGAYNCG